MLQNEQTLINIEKSTPKQTNLILKVSTKTRKSLKKLTQMKLQNREIQ